MQWVRDSGENVVESLAMQKYGVCDAAELESEGEERGFRRRRERSARIFRRWGWFDGSHGEVVRAIDGSDIVVGRGLIGGRNNQLVH